MLNGNVNFRRSTSKEGRMAHNSDKEHGSQYTGKLHWGSPFLQNTSFLGYTLVIGAGRLGQMKLLGEVNKSAGRY